MFDYVRYAITDLPAHFTNPSAPTGNVAATDNTPLDNPISNPGANLGRVLFYEKRLSFNDSISCASCHKQARGFSDEARFSTGFLGGVTRRHSMGLSNSKFHGSRRFFWDERASTLEQQALQPIEDPVELGTSLPQLQTELAAIDIYPPLFHAAFGSPEITPDRISKALAQFMRSMVSYQSRFDEALIAGNGVPSSTVLTASEMRGERLFSSLGCRRCHGTAAHIASIVHNTGLDATITDPGAGSGRFKVPSLRNIAVSAPYMHDGRFATLEEVIEFYNSGVQPNPNLSLFMREGLQPDGPPLRLNLSDQDKADLKAFLLTLTDDKFLTDPAFSDPF